MELSAVILTYNEAHHIEACIKSLAWADRIMVWDSQSEDDTVQIAERCGAEIGASKFENYAQQRNNALDGIETDWVFFVDADERGTPELADEIRDVIANRPEMGWEVPRHNYIFNRLTKGAGWYPDYQLRLLRHGFVRYDKPVHEVGIVDGEIGQLKNPLVHLNYTTPAHFHTKQRKYVRYDADILHAAGVQPKWFTPVTQAGRQFWWRFVTLKGYGDRLHGLRLSLLMGYYEFWKYRLLQKRG